MYLYYIDDISFVQSINRAIFVTYYLLRNFLHPTRNNKYSYHL